MKKIDVDKLAKSFKDITGISFKNNDLLLCALTHSSFAHENNVKSNERLEFLGDSVLGLVVSEKLFADSTGAPEGKLSQMRSHVVSEEPLAKLVKKLGLDELLLVGVGEKKNEPSRAMIADEMEAIIGAIYLDQGLNAAKKFVLDYFGELILNAETAKQINDSKSLLQEKYYNDGVRYKTTECGTEHEPCFNAVVYVGGKIVGCGKAKSKREAEKNAAKEALAKLEK